MDTLKQKILTIIEKNSRIDMKELAVLLGTGEIEIINAMQEGILLTDAAGGIVAINPKACALLQVSENCIGENCAGDGGDTPPGPSDRL